MSHMYINCDTKWIVLTLRFSINPQGDHLHFTINYHNERSITSKQNTEINLYL